MLNAHTLFDERFGHDVSLELFELIQKVSKRGEKLSGSDTLDDCLSHSENNTGKFF